MEQRELSCRGRSVQQRLGSYAESTTITRSTATPHQSCRMEMHRRRNDEVVPATSRDQRSTTTNAVPKTVPPRRGSMPQRRRRPQEELGISPKHRSSGAEWYLNEAFKKVRGASGVALVVAKRADHRFPQDQALAPLPCQRDPAERPPKI
jgi:hypothetical protein